MTDVETDRRIAIVTGAYGAIGLAIARQIAEHPHMEVVLVGRDERKLDRAVGEVRRATGNDHVRGEQVDLSRRHSIESFADRWRGPLHVLVNNAATTPRRRTTTPEGLESQFATNIMGYFWMIRAFAPVLEDSAPARIVNVASYWAGDLDIDDLQFERRRYDNNTAYRQSKQADRMLTVAFSEQLSPNGVTVNACHPGDVNSKLSNDLGFGGHESPDEGARTPVWLAMSPAGAEHNGKYFANERETTCRFGADRRAVRALYDACLKVAE